MSQIIAKKDFVLNNKFYFENDEIDINELKYEEIVRINEKGLIKPLCMKDLSIIKQLRNSKKIKKEEEL